MNCGCENTREIFPDVDMNRWEVQCSSYIEDADNYYTKKQVDDLIESATTSGNCCITEEEVDEKIASAKTEVESEIPSLDGYATEQWVEDKHYITGVDLSDYATKEYVSGYTYDKDTIDDMVASGGSFNPNNYYNKYQVDTLIANALSNYATNAEVIQNITNLQQQLDSIIASVSGCCGSTGETQYRWITMTSSNDYWCDGTTKKTLEKEQTSTDGIIWTDTSNIRSGSTVLQYDCVECGYVPPIVNKLSASYINGDTYIEDCDGNTTLTSASTKPSGYDYTLMRSAVIGDCVNVLDFGAFEECENLTSVTIADTVTTIKNNAFNQCYSLQSVVIPSGVTSIENLVFNACSGLTSVTIPDTVTTIGSGAFNYCLSLSSVTIPDSVTYIMASAFEYCRALQNVEIPSGVTRIGHDAFKDCTSLQSITCRATTPPELYIGGNFDNTNNCPIYVPNESLQDYKTASIWNRYADRIEGIVFEGKWKAIYSDTSVVTADCDATSAITSGEIASQDLIKVAVGTCVTEIGDEAFQRYTSLTSCTIGNSVTTIGNEAFANSNALQNINIPSSVTSIGSYAFRSCASLTSVNIPSGVTSIGNNAFLFCGNLTSITVEATTPPTLGSSAFDYTNNCPIYVPAASVSAYQTAWSDYASRIQAIP